MAPIDFAPADGSPRPQEGRSDMVISSLANLNGHEFNRMKRIIDEEYSTKQETILDRPLGEVINNTVNFFGNSVNSYYSKLMEAEFTQKLYTTDNTYLDKLQTHLLAITLFIRDDDNIIYLGIIMMILSILICFFNISRGYGYSSTDTKP